VIGPPERHNEDVGHDAYKLTVCIGMDQEKLFARARELVELEVSSVSPTLSEQLNGIKSKASAAGRLHSGTTIKQMYSGASDHLAKRSEIVLTSVTRVHSILMPGAALADDRDRCKAFAGEILTEQASIVLRELVSATASIFDEETLRRAEKSVSVPTDLIARKLAVELDLYFDRLGGPYTR
jgi:hypothetical protein